jgi:hypothetical protein
MYSVLCQIGTASFGLYFLFTVWSYANVMHLSFTLFFRINTLGAYLISPAIGAHFTMYMANMQGKLFQPFARTLDRNLNILQSHIFSDICLLRLIWQAFCVHLGHVAQSSIWFDFIIIQQVPIEPRYDFLLLWR